jgi:hypothetical protein
MPDYRSLDDMAPSERQQELNRMAGEFEASGGTPGMGLGGGSLLGGFTIVLLVIGFVAMLKLASWVDHQQAAPRPAPPAPVPAPRFDPPPSVPAPVPSPAPQRSTPAASAPVGTLRVVNRTRESITFYIDDYQDAAGRWHEPGDDRGWRLKPDESRTLTDRGATLRAAKVRYTIEAGRDEFEFTTLPEDVRGGVLEIKVLPADLR